MDLLMYLPLFGGMPSNDLNTLAAHMSFFELEPGEILFREGDPGESVCFVVQGGLDVLKEGGASGASAVIATVPRYRSIGEMSVIDNTPRSATVKARVKTAMVSLSKSGFDELLEQHPRIGIHILKQIARLISMNLRKTSSRLADYMLPLT
ncbi:MAG: cyclic nucleotide-binding domain-containing protein [Pseudomonadota bacterium]